MGMEQYFARLSARGLMEREVFNAQGNAVDFVAIDKRIGAAVAAWLRGGDIPAHRYPPMAVVARLYDGLRCRLENDGDVPLSCVHNTFPADVSDLLLSRLEDGPAAAGQAPLAQGRQEHSVTSAGDSDCGARSAAAGRGSL